VSRPIKGHVAKVNVSGPSATPEALHQAPLGSTLGGRYPPSFTTNTPNRPPNSPAASPTSHGSGGRIHPACSPSVGKGEVAAPHLSMFENLDPAFRNLRLTENFLTANEFRWRRAGAGPERVADGILEV